MLHCFCSEVQVQGLKFRDALSSNYVAVCVLNMLHYHCLHPWDYFHIPKLWVGNLEIRHGKWISEEKENLVKLEQGRQELWRQEQMKGELL